ncbi:MAG: hypothetical protein GX802_07625 [Clostridiales bacterium]|nr:hypothetical protein [Clostridiales bacterium]
MNTAVGKSIQRKDAWDKVTGKAKYADDFSTVGLLRGFSLCCLDFAGV